MREKISLDGHWDFYFDHRQLDTPPQLKQADWRTATIPAPWQANFADLQNKSGVGWYRRTVTLPQPWLAANQAIILHFGAADYFAQVWCNGVYLGSHEGGYLPFQFDIHPQARPETELLVRVVDPSERR